MEIEPSCSPAEYFHLRILTSTRAATVNGNNYQPDKKPVETGPRNNVRRSARASTTSIDSADVFTPAFSAFHPPRRTTRAWALPSTTKRAPHNHNHQCRSATLQAPDRVYRLSPRRLCWRRSCTAARTARILWGRRNKSIAYPSNGSVRRDSTPRQRTAA